ncbi:MAG: hypothetical protein NT018_07960 [Armatimonadetes bacterium]|nr:hypothetical protein [Armatimonadota bacterium]
MKVFACILGLMVLMSGAAGAAESKMVSLSVSDASMITAAEQLAKSAGVSIVVDPAIDTKVTLTLNDVELTTALDMLAKTGKATWKKVQYAKQTDSKVTLDQIKSSVLALAAMPLIAVSVDDASGKGASMFTRDLSTSPETSNIKLPEGYAWTTVYAIFAADKPAKKTETAAAKPSDVPSIDKEKLDEMGKTAFDKPIDLANMAPADRKRMLQNEMMGYMTLIPEARRQLLRDQMAAVAAMDPAMRNQYRKDLRDAMKVLNPPKQSAQPVRGRTR